MRHPWRRLRRQAAGIVALLLIASSGCSTPGPPPVFLHESARGAVSLDRLPPGVLRATQPAQLEESTVAQVLSGIRVTAQQRLLQDIVGGDAPSQAAFPRDDVAFLSPLVRQALRRAGPDDLVRFHARRSTNSGHEVTGGALYVKDGALVVALTEHRGQGGTRPPMGKADRAAIQSGGHRPYTISFLPLGVEVPLPDDPPDELRTGGLRLLAIDYALLARLRGLEPEPARESPARDAASGNSHKDEVRSEVGPLKELIIRKDLEIEALRQEVESLRRQLERSGSGQGR